MTDRICTDCKNFEKGYCRRGEKVVGIDPVYGNKIYKYAKGFDRFADDERHSIFPWNCGKIGRHFEKKGALDYC